MGKKLLAVWLGLALALLVVSYFFTYQEKIRINLDRIARTQEVLTNLNDLQNTLTLDEASARGYVITGDERYLNGFHASLKDTNQVFLTFEQLLRHEAEQYKQVEQLRPLIQQRSELLEKSVELRRVKGFEVAEHGKIMGEGAKVQEKIQKIFDNIERYEKKQLDPQWAKEAKKRQLYLWGLTVATFSSFTFLFVVLFLLNREFTQRKKAEDKLASYQEDLRSLASQLTLAEERERRRLAAHLHDHIGQTLAVANIKLGELRKANPLGDSASSMAELGEIRTLLEQAIQDTQSLTFRISSPILYELGLEAALEWLTENVPKAQGLLTYFEDDKEPKPLDEDVRVLLFQAVNELLVNVVKHARARHLNVSVWREHDQLHLGVEDDGQGFEVAKIGARWEKSRGFGLFSIRERLKPFGGVLTVDSSPGAGTSVTITVPLKKDEGQG